MQDSFFSSDLTIKEVEMPKSFKKILSFIKIPLHRPLQKEDITKARKDELFVSKGFTKWIIYGRSPPNMKVENIQVPNGDSPIPIRIYRPSYSSASKIPSKLPVCLYFHGGGYTLGSVESYDPICRKMANDLKCVFISVEYRLAPEYPVPISVDDCYNATKWISSHLEQLSLSSDKIYVMGDSAGGGIAALVTIRNQNLHDFTIAGQILMYPWVDARNCDHSFELFKEGYSLSAELMEIFTECLLSNGMPRDSLEVSPILNNSIENLPPAIIITASHDVLRDQGNKYAQKLLEKEIPVIYKNYFPTVHGFIFTHRILPRGNIMYKDFIQTVKKMMET